MGMNVQQEAVYRKLMKKYGQHSIPWMEDNIKDPSDKKELESLVKSLESTPFQNGRAKAEAEIGAKWSNTDLNRGFSASNFSTEKELNEVNKLIKSLEEHIGQKKKLRQPFPNLQKQLDEARSKKHDLIGRLQSY